MCAFVQISVSKLWLCVHNACAHICESTVVTCANICEQTANARKPGWQCFSLKTFQVQKQYSMILFNNEQWLEGFSSCCWARYLQLSSENSNYIVMVPTIRNVLILACTRFFLANCEEQFLCLKAKARQHSSHGNSRRALTAFPSPMANIFSPPFPSSSKREAWNVIIILTPCSYL